MKNKKILIFAAFAVLLSVVFACPSAAQKPAVKIRLLNGDGNILYCNFESVDAYANAWLENNDTETEGALISVVYKDDRLYDINYDRVTVPKGTSEVNSRGSVNIPPDSTAKVMFWAIPGMRPLGDVYRYVSKPHIPSLSGEYISLSSYDEKTQEAVAYMNSKINGKAITDFYATLYDADTSCFYSSTSGKYAYGYHPNIEATAQILNFVQEAAGNISIKNHLSLEQRRKMLQYVTDMYDPTDGYFYHTDAPKGVASTARISRDLDWAKKYILPYCGTNFNDFVKKYPNTGMLLMAAPQSGEMTDLERIAAFETVEEFVDFLELRWTENENAGKSPYALGDTFGGYAKAAREKGDEYYRAICNFVISKQNTDTGLWGEDVSYTSVSAAMKFAGFFKGADLPYQHYDKMVDSCIKVMLSDEDVQYIVYIWNPLSAMKQAMDTFSAVGQSIPLDFRGKVIVAMPEIIYKSMEKIEKFAKPDGGFSYEKEAGSNSIIGMNTGLGLFESDVDGTGKIRGVRSAVYDLLFLYHTQLIDEETVDSFFSKLGNAQPTVKNTNIPYTNNFEQYEINENEKPYDFVESIKDNQGSVRIIKDPKDSDRCLEVKSGLYSRTLTRCGGFSLASENGEVQTVEFDLMLEKNKAHYYYLTMGLTAVRLYVEGTGNSETFSLRYFTGTSYGSSTKITSLSYDTWHRIKVEYLPKGIDDTVVNVYIDGAGPFEIGYYNGDNAAALPKKSIACFSVSAATQTTGRLYIDNIRAYVTT